MDKYEKYRQVFAQTIKDFEENSTFDANIAAMETINPYSHKLIAKGDFSLPKDVMEEIYPLEVADLLDFKKEICKS